MTFDNIHFYAFIGWMLVSATIAVLWLIASACGIELFKRLRRVYHLIVIGYWLDRLEKEGTHCFQKADKTDC